MKKLLLITLLAFALIASANAAWVNAHVTDSQGNAITGATVTIAPANRGIILGATKTNSLGRSWPALLNANESYTVTVRKDGYESRTENYTVPRGTRVNDKIANEFQLAAQAPQPTPQPSVTVTTPGRSRCHWEISAFAFRGGRPRVWVCR